MTAVDVDEDVKVLEGLEFEIACQLRISKFFLGLMVSREEPCAEAATWLLQCRMCGVVKTCCDQHKAFVLSLPSFWCTCDSHGDPAAMLSFTLIGAN